MMNPEDEEEVLLEHFAKTNGNTYYSESDSEDENVLYDQMTSVPIGTTRNPSVRRYKYSTLARVFKTVLICLAFCCLGLCVALPGPTLLDLQERTNTDTETISRLFTGRSVGYLIGSIIGGVLFDRLKNHSCLLACSLIMAAVFNAAAPWSREILLLIIILAAEGFFLGFLDTGGNAVCIQIWGRKSAPYMQALHFCFGLGAFVAPLLSEPFLSDQLVNVTLLNATPTFNPPIALHHLHRRDVTLAPPTLNHSNISLPDVTKVKKPTKTSGNLLSTNKDNAAGHNVDSGFVKTVIEKQKEVARILNTPAPTTTVNPNVTAAANATSTVATVTTTNPPTTTVVPTTTSTTPLPTTTTTTTTIAMTTPLIQSTVAMATNSTTPAKTNDSDAYWRNLTHAIEEQIQNVVYDISHELTTIQFAYLIVSMVMVIVALAFCGDCCYSCCRKQLKFTKPSRLRLVKNPGVGFNFQLISLLFLFFFLYVGMEVTYGGLVFSFVVQQVHWDKPIGTFVTSVFWGSFALTRGVSIIVSKYLKPATMLICDLVLTVAGLLLLLITTEQYAITLWIGTAVLGCGMASIFPSGLSWAESYINVTGKVTGVFITASALGEMLLPALCGFLFEKKSPMFLIYVLFAASLVCVVVYILMQNLAFNRGEKYHLFSRVRNADRAEPEEIALTPVTDTHDRSHSNGALDLATDVENGHGQNGHAINNVDDRRSARTTVAVLRQILREEGWQGIYRGAGPMIKTLFCSYYVYFFAYNQLRSFTPGEKPTPMTDLTFSLIAAMINVMVTAPLFLVQTRMKLQGSSIRDESKPPPPEYKGLIDGVLNVYRSEGVGVLWKGTVPSLILCVNPAVQMMLYEAMKRAAQVLFKTKELSAMVYFVLGAASKSLATIATYPLQVLQSRMRSGRQDAESRLTVWQAMSQIFRSQGLSGLFKGLEAKLLQTMLNAALMFMCYEKIFVLLKQNIGQP